MAHRGLGFALATLFGVALPASADTTPKWPERPVLSADLGELPARTAPLRVFLDAGHGAEDNTGNRSAYCTPEQDFTLSLAEDVRRELDRLGFATRLSRSADERVSYAVRAQEAAAWGADVLVSLHSDIRGRTSAWSPRPGVSCLRNHEAPGFSVLYSDAGEDAAAAARKRFADQVAVAMDESGFLAYDGAHYGVDYAAGSETGVFLDRHPKQKRIFMLYATSMPAILIETHNALDDREVRLWESADTRLSFARALATALARASSR